MGLVYAFVRKFVVQIDPILAILDFGVPAAGTNLMNIDTAFWMILWNTLRQKKAWQRTNPVHSCFSQQRLHLVRGFSS